MIRNILKISELNVTFRGASEEFTAVDNFSLEQKAAWSLATISILFLVIPSNNAF